VQVPDLRELLRRHGHSAVDVRVRKPALLDMVKALELNEPKSTGQPPAPVVVVLEVYDICNPVLPVRAAISAVVEQDAAGAWFAVVPLDFRLVWASSSASFLGVLDINLDPNLAAFMDPNDTKASSQLVRATVMEAGSSGHFKADNDTASGDASASPEVKSSELRAAHL